MSTKPVRVVARIKAKRDRIARVREVLVSLLEPTRGESGCVVYELLQNDADPADFTFVEEWSTGQALEAHFASPHFEQASAALADLLAEPPDIRRYTLIGQ